MVSGDPVGEKFQFDLLERYLETLENVKEIDPMGVDVELLENGMIPVGEAISQHWPYMQPPGRAIRCPDIGPATGIKRQNHPFAKLSELKK